jgi:hypothetical protein
MVQTMHLYAPKLTLSPKGPKGDSTWATSPRSSIGCVQIISELMLHMVQTMHLSCTKTNTISKWTETRFYMIHVTKEFHRVRPKWFPSLRYVRCNRCIQNDFWGYGTFGANCGSILHWDLHYHQIDWNKILHDPRHLGVTSGASNTISELTVHLPQTVQLSCTKISTISKRTEMSYHLSLVT